MGGRELMYMDSCLALCSSAPGTVPLGRTFLTCCSHLPLGSAGHVAQAEGSAGHQALLGAKSTSGPSSRPSSEKPGPAREGAALPGPEQ